VSDLPAALLLDLDDTILRFSSGAAPAWRQVCREFAPPGCDPDALVAAIRRVADEFWADRERARRGRLDLLGSRTTIVGGALEALGVDDAARVARIAESYERVREQNLELFPGAREALHGFRSRGVRMALLTNGEAVSQRGKVDRFELGGFFEAVLIEGELGFGKPDARVFELGLEHVGAHAGEAWMVGDNLHADVGGAQAAGIHGVWHDFDRRGLPVGAPERPDRIVHSLGELL